MILKNNWSKGHDLEDLLWLSMILQVKFPFVDRIHPGCNNVVTGENIRATVQVTENLITPLNLLLCYCMC